MDGLTSPAGILSLVDFLAILGSYGFTYQQNTKTSLKINDVDEKLRVLMAKELTKMHEQIGALNRRVKSLENELEAKNKKEAKPVGRTIAQKPKIDTPKIVEVVDDPKEYDNEEDSDLELSDDDFMLAQAERVALARASQKSR